MTNGIKLFPKIEDVFVDNFDSYSDHFMPIASIDLSSINNLLSGKIHIVYFNNDPYCKEAGEYFNEYCDHSKVSFEIIENKYILKTDFGYFKTNDDWVEWLEQGKESYQKKIEKFSNEGSKDIIKSIKNIGGQPEW